MKYTVYADGGSRGNPGNAGAGAVVLDTDGRELIQISESLGHTTNNVAEYTAVIRALQELSKKGGVKEESVEVRMDSELVVKQMKGQYKIKHPNLKPLAEKMHALIPQFGSVSFTHVPRENNKRADELANEAMDRAA